MADTITLRGLKVYGYHGVFDFERREGQDFLVDVELRTDTRPAAASDALGDTVDYGELAEEIAAIIAGEPLNLIETLAERIADHCLRVAQAVTVTVHKPAAPVPLAFDDVAVTITRTAVPEAPVAAAPEAPVTTAPEAPVGSVSAAEAPARGGAAVIALGANLGDPIATLRAALQALNAHPHIEVVAASSAFVTAPVGGIAQPDFTNAVAFVSTTLDPIQLLGVCQGIELACGRTREIRWGPRTLDLDLIRCTAAAAGHAAASAGSPVGASAGSPAGAEAVALLTDAAAELVVQTPTLSLPHPRAAERAFVLAPWAQLAPQATVRAPAAGIPIAEALAAAADAGTVRDTGEQLFDPAGAPTAARSSAEADHP